jgi:CRISPR system Cascade subunit CasA
MQLINDRWIPLRRRDGTSRLFSPTEITTDYVSNPVVGPDWGRPDFQLAALEWLIGLLAVAMPPADEDEWEEGWSRPPSAGRIQAALAPYALAFNLDGEGPRFGQDLENLPGEPDTPESLLIEAPGDNSRRNNTTLLNKPDRVRVMGRAAAAMAVFTLQTYAPSGGRGNLTSVRGGGPLTTLVIPGQDGDKPLTLWQLVWANVPDGKPVPIADLPKVLPWLAPTRTADKFPKTTPDVAHPLQAFWGMPRRLRLDFAPNTERLPCDVTGMIDDIIVTGWRQRPNGVKYEKFQHPLSPYYKDAQGQLLPVHPQPGGIGYRHWLGLVTGDGTTSAASMVQQWWKTRGARVPTSVQDGTRLLAGGYDMDNAKARAFVESEMPMPGARNTAQLEELAKALVRGADIVARALRMALRDAVMSRDAKLDSAPLATAFEAFWGATEPDFFAHLRDGAADPPADTDHFALVTRAGKLWLARLKSLALLLFDEGAPLNPSAASFNPERIVAARRLLQATLEGYGKSGQALFALLLLNAPPAKPPKPAKKGKSHAA